jgi:hypothetical protein
MDARCRPRASAPAGAALHVVCCSRDLIPGEHYGQRPTCRTNRPDT